MSENPYFLHIKTKGSIFPWVRYLAEFEVSEDLKCFIAEKGSVALEGVSLTVNEVSGNQFGVNIINHTQSFTTFGEKSVGDRVNLEIDMLARYVSRLMEKE